MYYLHLNQWQADATTEQALPCPAVSLLNQCLLRLVFRSSEDHSLKGRVIGEMRVFREQLANNKPSVPQRNVALAYSLFVDPNARIESVDVIRFASVAHDRILVVSLRCFLVDLFADCSALCLHHLPALNWIKIDRKLHV